MSSGRDPRGWLREELLHLQSVSATLAGLSITGVTLFHALGKGSLPDSIADDLLALSALLFLTCTYTIFVALRTRRPAVAVTLEKISEVLLLVALSAMVVSGLILVYTVW